MALQGKGFFTNNLSDCEGGDAAAIAQTARTAGLSFVVLKIAEGIQLAGSELLPAVVEALKAAGIQVWGWHLLTGADPDGEAKTACERVSLLGLGGYVIHTEAGFERPGREPIARQFMTALRAGMKVPIALCSFHFPSFHPDFPWSAFLEGCDLHMPKVFWELGHNGGEQLRESKSQCEALPNARPYIPVGAAYRTTSWAPAPEDVTEFLDTARRLDLPGAAFFQWDACRKYLPRCWEAAAGFPWPASPSMPTEAPRQDSLSDAFAAQFLAGLNARQADAMSGLYDAAAVRTWADETQHGLVEIRQAYVALFGKLPQGMTFQLSRASVDEDVRRLTWKAGQLCGETTLLMREGKIILDHTFVK